MQRLRHQHETWIDLLPFQSTLHRHTGLARSAPPGEGRAGIGGVWWVGNRGIFDGVLGRVGGCGCGEIGCVWWGGE